MKFTALSFPAPEQNIACDEALLESSEQDAELEILRVWQSETYFAVLGYSNQAGQEADVESCQKNQIPILRRISGGGTVLQGPGCLNYALTLQIKKHPELKNITLTNRFVMDRHQDLLEKFLAQEVQVQGDTDLTLQDLKFSGNSQKRGKNAVLFHGTFLTELDLSLIAKYLKVPSKQPGYRRQRKHQDFLTHLPVPADKLISLLKKCWGATEKYENPPWDKTDKLVKEKYGRREWNFKF